MFAARRPQDAPTRLRAVADAPHDARDMWRLYEAEKRRIAETSSSAAEYESQLAELMEKLKL